jgi:hypothetical protein
LQTDLKFSSAYHPQSDGQTKRVNQSLEMYLCCAVQAAPTHSMVQMALPYRTLL